MLTKTDLLAIEKLVARRVREEIETEGKNIRSSLKSDIINTRMRVQMDIRDLADRTKNLEVSVNNLEKETKNGFKKLDKRFTGLFDFLDEDFSKTKKRIQIIEEHLHLEPAA